MIKRKKKPQSKHRSSNPLSVDPTRTITLRRRFIADLNLRFARIKAEVVKLVIDEDALGLKDTPSPLATNVFCATGEGGGVDPTCSPGEGDGGIAVDDPLDLFLSESVDTEVEKQSQSTLKKFKDELNRITDKAVLREVKAASRFLGDKTKAMYSALEKRYGKTAAIACMASGQAVGWGSLAVGATLGVPLVLPGASIWGSLPAVAVAETILQVSKGVKAIVGNEGTEPITEEQIKEEGRKLMEELQRQLEEYLRKRQKPPTTNTRWKFNTTAEKLTAFKAWLKTLMAKHLIGKSEQDLWKEYIQQGFAKGAGRAFDDVKADSPREVGQRGKVSDFYKGSRDQFLRSSFARPISIERVQTLASRTLTDLEGVTEQMSTVMVRTLTDGLVMGKSPREVARDLTQVVDISRQRAEVIARTETIRAHAEGQLDSLEAMGVEEVGVAVEWSTTGDDKVCDLCAPLQGVVLKLEEARGMLPRHPNAVFAGSTFTSYGQCQELVRAKYRGPAVILTACGGLYRTTIGPNHPMMTNRGMVKAAQIRKGDKVLYDLRHDGSTLATSRGHDYFKQVVAVEDVFQACLAVSHHLSVTASGVDFHGDGVYCEGKVDVVHPIRGLLTVADTSGIEQLRESHLVGTDSDTAFLPRLGSGFPNGYRVFLPSASGMSSANSRVETDSHFIWLDVHSVSFIEFEGWAFDASTDYSLFCSDGFVVSNCRCAWIPANVGESSTEQKDSRRSIKSAFDESVAAEVKDPEDSRWIGADREVDKVRPESILNNLRVEHPNLAEFSTLLMNVFCPTGPGGGIDPTCSPGGGGVLPASLHIPKRFADKLSQDQVDHYKRLASERGKLLNEVRHGRATDTDKQHIKDLGEALDSMVAQWDRKFGFTTEKSKSEATKKAADKSKDVKTADYTARNFGKPGQEFSKEELKGLHAVKITRMLKAREEPAGSVNAHGMSKSEDMVKVKVNGTEFVYPESLRARVAEDLNQFHDPARAPDGEDVVHPTLWAANQRVVYTNQRNQHDSHWEKEYGIPNFVSHATGGDGTIVVYNKDTLGVRGMAHEAGHNLATQVFGSTHPDPLTPYGIAQTLEKPVSSYGSKSPAEDFAEACRLFNDRDPRFRNYAGHTELRNNFPQKYEALEKIFRIHHPGGIII